METLNSNDTLAISSNHKKIRGKSFMPIPLENKSKVLETVTYTAKLTIGWPCQEMTWARMNWVWFL
jgi:hypothetical protein